MLARYIIVVILFCAALPLVCAQGDEESGNLESVAFLRQTTYEYDKDNVKRKTSYKYSIFDTSAILIKQERYQYIRVDTGDLVSSYHYFEYNPATALGSSYTERFVTPRNKDYLKHSTEFKSFDHQDKRLWVKQFDTNKKLQSETENTYDAQGLLVKTVSRDHTYNPPLLQTDEMTRNRYGLMTRWIAFDDDGTKREQVRDFSWEYRYDTLLLVSSGYAFNNWNETRNSYSKNVLTKSVQNMGTRNPNGKTKILTQITTTYANGKPIKAIEKNDGKVTRTITHRHEANFSEEIIETPEGKTVHSVKEIYQNTLLLERSWTTDGKVNKSETHQYDAHGNILRTVQIVHRDNNDEWKTELLFNNQGNLIHRMFYIKKHLKQEDIYEYQYF